MNAAVVIFAHNHSSGIAEPSVADRRVIDCMRVALDLIEIKALDHMVGGYGCRFFRRIRAAIECLC